MVFEDSICKIDGFEDSTFKIDGLKDPTSRSDDLKILLLNKPEFLF